MELMKPFKIVVGVIKLSSTGIYNTIIVLNGGAPAREAGQRSSMGNKFWKPIKPIKFCCHVSVAFVFNRR